MDDGHTFTIRPYTPTDLPRLQEITARTFGPVSIDRNMEEKLGAFGQGGWQGRKVAAIADDCRLQPDGVFVAREVLAKHDEKYMPPEVADALNRAGAPQHATKTLAEPVKPLAEPVSSTGKE